jgi:hypothetical protein
MDNMKLEIKSLISYSQIFQYKKFNYYGTIKRLPSKDAIAIVSYVLARRMALRIDQTDFEIMVPTLFKYTSHMQHSLIDYLRRINISEYHFVDEMALLYLLNDLFVKYNGKIRKFDRKDYDDLLYCYLKCCDRRLEQNGVIPNVNMSNSEWISAFIPKVLHENSLCGLRDYRLGLIKGYYLLIKFPGKNERFNFYLLKFLKQRHIVSADNYLYQLMTMYLFLQTKKEYPVNQICIGKNDNVNRTFFDNFCIVPECYEDSKNLKLLRDNPLLKYRDNHYIIIYNRFLIDKFFTGIIFDIAKENISENMPFAKIYGSIKQLIGQEFSERYLFYEIMRRIFPISSYISYTGDELKDVLKEGEPDFYIRKDNKIFLFEFKDELMKGEVACSEDYDLIEKETFRMFVTDVSSNGKLKPKGVMQLANVIEKKLPVILSEIDKTDQYNKFEIYPVLVYYDSCFDIEGFNYILNSKFQNIIKDKQISESYLISDVLMVNIHTFMYIEDYLSDEKIIFDECIDKYNKFKAAAELNKVYPFNKFLENQAKEKGYKFLKTKWFDDIINEMKSNNRPI